MKRLITEIVRTKTGYEWHETTKLLTGIEVGKNIRSFSLEELDVSKMTKRDVTIIRYLKTADRVVVSSELIE